MPANVISASGRSALSASAMARAGYTCPPVPPAANSTRSGEALEAEVKGIKERTKKDQAVASVAVPMRRLTLSSTPSIAPS